GIRNLFTFEGLHVGGVHQRALGVTYVKSFLGLKASTTALPIAGGYCVYITNVGAQFGWQRMEVYVAAEFQPESCEYRTVLDHENQHVAINKATVKEYAPKARGALEQILAEQKPIFTADPNGVANIALDELHKRMEATMNDFQTTMGQRNGAIDTSSN